MVLSRVYLIDDPAHSWLIGTNDYKQVLTEEADFGERVDDLDVREVLSIGADLVLTLDDKYPFVSQNAVCFPASLIVNF